MANVSLQDIVFPGISNVYKVPVVDNTLAVAGAAADAKKTGDEIGAIKNDLTQLSDEMPNKANIDGSYDNMTVGNAKQLVATVGITDKVPYNFRTSGGSNDIGDREDVRKIVGVSIPWNQKFNKAVSVTHPASSSGSVSIDSTTGTVTISPDGASAIFYWFQSSTHSFAGHKVFMSQKVTASASCGYALQCETMSSYTNISANVGTTINKIISVGSYTGTAALGGAVQNITEAMTITAEDIQLVDLTLAIGTSIADYVYSLETATAGAGVAWLKKHFPAQFNSGYQAYDAGSMQSVSGLTAHKMVGFNQWDEEVELGGINENTGAGWSTNDRIRSKNFIPVLPNTVYYLKAPTSIGTLAFYDADKNFISALTSISANYIRTTPSNAWYMKFNMPSGYGTTYNHDICINFHWDGEKDGTYEPYKTWSYALDDSVVIRGIPKVDANGNLYYDGDEYLPDGTVNRRYGIVDLGSLNWAENITNVYFTTITDINPQSDSDGYDTRQKGLVCQKYVTDTQYSISQSMNDKTWLRALKSVYIKDTAYSDVVSFKTAMSGVYLVYELATPTIETADPYQETQIVDDWGTEEYVLSDGAFPVPVGHDTMYQNNLRAKLEMSPESPDGDGLYVVQQESGENTYVPLASTATIQDILTRLTALENA